MDTDDIIATTGTVMEEFLKTCFIIFVAIPEAPRGLVILGSHLHYGIEQKGLDTITDCIKKCANAGEGIPVSDFRNNILLFFFST